MEGNKVKKCVPYLELERVTASFGGEIERKVAATVASGWYLQGKETEEFEREYAAYTGTRHAIGCGNGLDALRLIFRAYIEMGILQKGDEIIVQGDTFIASILALTDAGLVPVVADVDPDTLQLSAGSLRKVITPRTKGLLLVHLYGRCGMTPEIESIVRENKLLLVEDNAQAHGALWEGRRTGSLGHAAAHSFYPGKNLGALGDAGCITTDSDELAAVVRRLGNYGSERKYIFKSIGFNSRLDEIQAAVLRLKLKRLDKDTLRRREIAARYRKEINNPFVRIPDEGAPGEHVYHIFPVLSPYRDRLKEFLEERGIGTLVHYPVPPHLQECYAGKDLLRIPYPLDETEHIARRELSLPLSPVMTDEEVNLVIEAVNDFNVDCRKG